jgi:hypothetical protein
LQAALAGNDNQQSAKILRRNALCHHPAVLFDEALRIAASTAKA